MSDRETQETQETQEKTSDREATAPEHHQGPTADVSHPSRRDRHGHKNSGTSTVCGLLTVAIAQSGVQNRVVWTARPRFDAAGDRGDGRGVVPVGGVAQPQLPVFVTPPRVGSAICVEANGVAGHGPGKDMNDHGFGLHERAQPMETQEHVVFQWHPVKIAGGAGTSPHRPGRTTG
jgi:hypothetical protein